MPKPKRTDTSSSSRSKSSKSSKSSKASKHDPGCDCIDCRDLSARETAGTVRKNSQGDTVREWNGDGAPGIHCHVQPGLFSADDNENHGPSPPSRTNTGGSTRSGRSGDSGREKGDRKVKSSHTKDRDGNLVETASGSEAPGIRTHYNWDDPTRGPEYSKN